MCCTDWQPQPAGMDEHVDMVQCPAAVGTLLGSHLGKDQRAPAQKAIQQLIPNSFDANGAETKGGLEHGESHGLTIARLENQETQATSASTSFRTCEEPPHSPEPSQEPDIHVEGASGTDERPNFDGVWKMERTENLRAFLTAVGYNWVFARAAEYAQVTQTLHRQGDLLSITVQVTSLPPPYGDRRTSVLQVGAPLTRMTDDTGREVLVLNPYFKGKVFTAGVRYANLPDAEITSERSLVEEDLLLEHVKFPAKGIEMRRYFRKQS